MCGAEAGPRAFPTALLGVQGIGMGTEGMAGCGALTTLTLFLVFSQALGPAKVG